MKLAFRPRWRLGLSPETGEINAAAAIAGLAVTTVVGGVAATSAGSLIPVAQDSAAQQNAAQVATAQGLAKIMDGAFTDTAGLEAGAYLPEYREASGPRRFITWPGTVGECFVVVSRSATGRHYFTTDRIPAPEELLPGLATGCLTAAEVQQMAAFLDAAAV